VGSQINWSFTTLGRPLVRGINAKGGGWWRVRTNHAIIGGTKLDQLQFEPQVMFFGLTNSPATFQALMNTIFTDLVIAGKVAVYLDDILIYSSTWEEHCNMIHKVLRQLRMHNLYLQPEKWEFD
jgi:hypothetical protein